MSIKKIISVVALILTMGPLARSQNVEEAKQLIENERFNSAELLLEKVLVMLSRNLR